PRVWGLPWRTPAAHPPRLPMEPLRTSHAPLLFAALEDARIYAYVPDEFHATVDSLIRRYAFLERGGPPRVRESWRTYASAQEDFHATVDSLIRRYAFLERGAPPGVSEVWLNWALQRVDTRAYIGTLQATSTPDSHASIGYVLTPPAWGQGFATEACRWLLAALQRRFVLNE